MEGITVLSTETISYTLPFIFLTVLAAIPFATFTWIFIQTCQESYKDGALIAGMLVLTMIAAAVFSFCFISIFNQKDETVYKVTIDDNVSFKEFQKRYEIIEIEDDIYTVKERTK